MKAHYVTTIEKYSDYDAHDPYWISLYRNIDDKSVRQAISDSLNRFFDRYGPDANEDYAGSDGPLMQRETAVKALKYAFRECKKMLNGINIYVLDLIDRGYSMETDVRDNDPVTGNLLHAIPIYADGVVDEMDYLIEQDELSKDDWVWLDFVINGFGEHNSDVNAKLRQLTRKHR